MKDICEPNVCTACRACVIKCPKHCISMVKDEMDVLVPQIDLSLCVNCQACIKVCPNNNTVTFRPIQKVYAAWNKDNKHRLTSASGGIAAAFYYSTLKKGGFAYGVTMDLDEGAYFVELTDISQIESVKNSKYVFSNTKDIYINVKERLLHDKEVLFIGLPCQIAGLLNYLGKSYDKLTTVDLICHGTVPFDYLKQHVKHIERKKQVKAANILFRDPRFHTFNYVFSLYKEKGRMPFYTKKVHDDDTYQLGYHYGLVYRNNCYECKYARRERISDITIGDFTGLGKEADFSHPRQNVSSVMVHTSKGESFLEKCKDLMFLEERPIKEAYYDKQMRSPSVRHDRRKVFEGNYKKHHDYDLAVRKAMYKQIVNNTILNILHINELRIIIRNIVPQPIKRIIKGLF